MSPTTEGREGQGKSARLQFRASYAIGQEAVAKDVARLIGN